MQDIVTLIQSVGFPIAACVALYVENQAQRKSHKEEMLKLASVIEKNTLAITKLTDHLEDK